MDKIFYALQALPEVSFPSGLHGKIMRQLFFLKFRVPFFVISGILFCNIAIVGYHAWLRMIDTEAFSIAVALFDGFEWSFDFFSEFARTVIEYFPVGSFTIIMLNALLFGYVVWAYTSFKKFSVVNQ